MNKYPLLIEIGCEDLPSEVISGITREASEKITQIFRGKRISFKGVNIFVAPRRIAVKVDEVSSHQNPMVDKVKGPPVKIAYKDGKATAAGLGFAKKMNVDFADLKVEKTSKGKYYCCIKEHSGTSIRDLMEEIVKDFLKSFNFSVTMRWPGCEIQFPRPIRWLLVKLGKISVKVNIGTVKSSKTSFGHRVYADKKIIIDDIKDYEKILKQNYVLANPLERKEYLVSAIDRVLKYTPGYAVKKESLLEEVNNSLEYPTGVKGRFPEKYLKMPRVVIEACLIHHQQFFPVEDKEGNLLNYFVGVRDGISEYLEPIRKGYEKVLIARLKDAEFFLGKDREQSLEEHVVKLKGIEFTRNLGTLYDKTIRCCSFSEYILSALGKDEKFIKTVKKIALLAKADLTTHMVEEFPELEGNIGRIYAEMDGEEKKVAKGIYQHYQPRTYEDKIPELDEPAVVGVAHRIDTLCGNMGKGVQVSGSEDPFGMRRTCRGLIRILIGKKWSVNLEDFIDYNCEIYSNQGISFEDENIVKLKNFIFLQIRQILEEKFTYDIVRCVTATEELNPYVLYEKALSIKMIKKSKGFDSLITAFKRINNILKQADERNINIQEKYDARKLRESVEKELSRKFKEVSVDVESMIKNNDFIGVLRKLSSLRVVVDRFFDEVLVMDKDESVMKNRLSMLKNIVELFSPAGDISKL